MVRYQLVLSALVISTACAPPTGGPNNPGPLLCEVEADCLGAQTCVLGTGECRDLQAGECRRDDANLCACELNSHCPQGYRCGGSGLCEPENGGGGGGGRDAGPTPGTDAGTPGGGECEATSDCPIDQFCSPSERACADLPEGTCRQDNQCASGRCNVPEGREIGRCEGGAGECTDNSDCEDGEMCEDGSCVGGGGGGCESNFDCAIGQLCTDGRCVQDTRCFSDQDCGDRQACQQLECVDVECTRDDHCGDNAYCGDNYSCVQGEREDDHGNTFETATVVDDNGQTPGVLNYAGDVDVFRFRSTVDGVYIVGTTGTTDTTCSLVTADDNVLGTNDDGGEGSNCRVSFNLVAGAIFQVRVNGFLNRTGDYTLTITRPDGGGNNGGGNNGGNDDHGNDVNNATRVTDDSTTRGRIEQGQDNDYFTFVAGATATYRITTISQIDTHCTLYDSNGGQLELDDDDGEGRNCQIARALTLGQTYFVMVRHFSAAGTGDYQLQIARGPEDQGGDRNSAQRVELPARVEAELTQRDEDFFVFRSGAAGMYRLETVSNIDTRCKLIDDAGNELSDNDDGGAGTNCRIDFELAAATTYYFAVRGFVSTTTGPYTAVIGPQ